MVVWPPSQPARILCEPERDFSPLMPRPEYRPWPEPRPRPTRFRSSRGCAGWRLERLSCFSGIGLGVLDLHEVADLAEHAGEHRGLLVLGAAADAAEPERSPGTAMPLGQSDLGPDLGDQQLGH